MRHRAQGSKRPLWNRSRWTPEHDATARMMLYRGFDCDDIGEKLGYSAEYVQRQIKGKPGPGQSGRRGEWHSRPTEALLEDAERVRAARFARDDAGRASGDLTAEFLGDPPPGRSALDRKRAAEKQ